MTTQMRCIPNNSEDYYEESYETAGVSVEDNETISLSIEEKPDHSKRVGANLNFVVGFLSFGLVIFTMVSIILAQTLNKDIVALGANKANIMLIAESNQIKCDYLNSYIQNGHSEYSRIYNDFISLKSNCIFGGISFTNTGFVLFYYSPAEDGFISLDKKLTKVVNTLCQEGISCKIDLSGSASAVVLDNETYYKKVYTVNYQ